MHHKIIVKVWADDEDEAQNYAKDALEDSVDPSNNNTGWDYVSDEVERITEAKLPAFGVSSFDELEKKYQAARLEQIQTLQQDIRRHLLEDLAESYLTKDEAPLFVSEDNDDLNKIVEKILKSKKKSSKPLPKDFNSLLDLLVTVLTDVSTRKYGMVMYYMGQIEKLKECIDNPESLEYTLQCTDNHFAEIPKENTNAADDSQAFYFWGDRHM